MAREPIVVETFILTETIVLNAKSVGMNAEKLNSRYPDDRGAGLEYYRPMSGASPMTSFWDNS